MRALPRIRFRYAVVFVAILAAIGWLVAGPLTGNIQYFRTVSEAVESEQADRAADRRFRLAGEVVEGSVRETAAGVEFEVTDGTSVASVVHRGDPPQLFADGVPVVCEGRWEGAHFASDRILIRHGNEYSPPEVDTTVPGASQPDGS